MSPAPALGTLFQYDRSLVVREPLGTGDGWWAGAPGAFFDRRDGCMYLTYRYRRPRGVDPDRGGETRLARSRDGVAFEDIAALTKDQLDSPSIERCAIHRTDGGRWLYYVSYVDGADGRWRVDLIEADAPDAFDPASRQPVFTADVAPGIEGVKDPWVLRVGPLWYMLLSYARAPEAAASDADKHGTADIYNTGLTLSCSALATSLDGRRWTWQGDVLHPTRAEAWDGYAARLGAALPHAGGWLGFYDGSTDVSGNYEERTGLALGADLLTWHSITPDGPALVSPHATGCLRYMDCITDGRRWWLYFEAARPDGSHDLRVVPSTAP
jgi:hypothetical protein